MDTEIDEWVDRQIKDLLAANKDGVLRVDEKKFYLSRQDFLDLTNIAQNHVRVHQYNRRTSEQVVRTQIIKEKGFDSEEYLDLLIEN